MQHLNDEWKEKISMEKTKGFWSVGRLVVGIILFVLSMFILFQSCATGLVNAL